MAGTARTQKNIETIRVTKDGWRASFRIAVMKRRKLTNKELDSLGQLVVKAGAVDESEIDRAVADPKLFEAVLSRIAATAESSNVKTRWSWKPVAAYGAVALMISTLVAGYFSYEGGQPTNLARVTPMVYTVGETKGPINIDPVRQPQPPNVEDDIRPVPAVLNRTVDKPVESKVRRPKEKTLHLREADFHPIGGPENAEDAVLDGRVVRVEMPRSALFALGVDLPLENGTKAVKADLLVGADGITRGIRLVE